MMSFEGEQFLGAQGILEKLHKFGTVHHKITTFDAQPNGEGIICMVSGDLSIEGGNPLKFAQTFHLAKGGAAGYYVHNDLFRLNYG